MLLRNVTACPLCCAGMDRFQYIDKFGEGDYHCRKCGVELLLGRLPVALVATAGATPAPSCERMRALAQRIWDQARPVPLHLLSAFVSEQDRSVEKRLLQANTGRSWSAEKILPLPLRAFGRRS